MKKITFNALAANKNFILTRKDTNAKNVALIVANNVAHNI